MSPASSIDAPGSPVTGLLQPDEPPPVRLFHPAGRAPLLLVCDHAANRIPRALNGLGLAPPDLARHIAWDIGAATVTEHLAVWLDAPAVLANYSRLVVDLNRPLDSATLIAPESDATGIPGNRNLAPAAREARLAAIYRPYHRAVADAVEARLAAGVRPVLLSIHSFTPAWDGFQRPWQLGVLWNQDDRLAVKLLAVLRRQLDLTVGDNEPYSSQSGPNQTLDAHAEDRGLASAAIEIRQDLIERPEGASEWAERLARVLAPLLLDPALHAPR